MKEGFGVGKWWLYDDWEDEIKIDDYVFDYDHTKGLEYLVTDVNKELIKVEKDGRKTNLRAD